MVSDVLRAQAAQYQSQADLLNQAADLLDKGYQSDQATIDQAVSDQLTAIIAPIQETINAKQATPAEIKP